MWLGTDGIEAWDILRMYFSFEDVRWRGARDHVSSSKCWRTCTVMAKKVDLCVTRCLDEIDFLLWRLFDRYKQTIRIQSTLIKSTKHFWVEKRQYSSVKYVHGMTYISMVQEDMWQRYWSRLWDVEKIDTWKVWNCSDLDPLLEIITRSLHHRLHHQVS